MRFATVNGIPHEPDGALHFLSPIEQGFGRTELRTRSFRAGCHAGRANRIAGWQSGRDSFPLFAASARADGGVAGTGRAGRNETKLERVVIR